MLARIAKFHALIILLNPHEVDEVRKLLLETVYCDFSLLQLQYLHQVPLEVVVVSTEVILDLEHI